MTVIARTSNLSRSILGRICDPIAHWPLDPMMRLALRQLTPAERAFNAIDALADTAILAPVTPGTDETTLLACRFLALAWIPELTTATPQCARVGAFRLERTTGGLAIACLPGTPLPIQSAWQQSRADTAAVLAQAIAASELTQLATMAMGNTPYAATWWDGPSCAAPPEWQPWAKRRLSVLTHYLEALLFDLHPRGWRVPEISRVAPSQFMTPRSVPRTQPLGTLSHAREVSESATAAAA